ncbi:MAG: zinc-ribbon domain-containing protein [Caldiserica bacterium]|nr:zinc-ribbon domain-containing protein [Caldisericota bacterium]
MLCPTCGKQIPDESTFCPACGTKLTASPAGTPRTAPRNTQERVIRLALILVPMLVVGIVLGVVVSRYNRSHSVTNISDRFVAALQQRDMTTLNSLMTVNGARPDATQLQAFCAWAVDANQIQEIRQQLLVSSSASTSGADSSVPADRYLSFVEKKLFVLKSYSVDVAPAKAVFSGRSSTVVTLDGVGQQTMGSDTLEFSSLLPGEYAYTTQLPTALGQLTGSGSLAVEPLTGGMADVADNFDNGAWFKVPTDIATTSISLNGTSVPLQSSSSGSSTVKYVGPFPAQRYSVLVGTPAPWGTATYAGTTSSGTGVSTITTTGISDATYAKLREIAVVIDTFNMNVTLLLRGKLASRSKALEGLEPQSPTWVRIQRLIASGGSGSSTYDKMTLAGRFYALSASLVKVVCSERYTMSFPTWVYTLVYRDGKFLIRDNTQEFFFASDYLDSPRSIVITHEQ